MNRFKLLFDLPFRKADDPYEPPDKEKKAMLLFCGRDDVNDLFQHAGGVTQTDTFDANMNKIRNGLRARTNSVVQRNMLLANFP